MTSLRSRQRGITLLEILASLGIMAAVITGVAKLADQYVADTKTALTAQQMVTVGNAAQAYIKDNYTTVMANATATTPALITVPMLTGAGYLQSGFSTKNNFGQDVCVLVLEPTANNLNALVIAEGGTAIDDLSLGTVAVGIGAAGGGVYSSAATTLRGAMGGWSVAVGNYANANNMTQKCDGTAGTPTIAAGHPIMALWFSNGDVTSGFLYRNSVPGRPELNTMNTPIVMNSVQTANSACTTTGAIARDSNGAILSCQAGTWRSQGSSYWKDPVANYAALPASGDPVGAVRMTLDNGRAFMWTGGAWSALAVDQNGNLTVPGTLTAAGGKVIAWNAVGEGGVLQLVGANGTSMYLESLNGKFRLVNSPWSAEIFSVDQSGNVVANGRLTTNEYVQINGTATEGAACSPNGLVGRDGTGLLLSCQSGVWVKLGRDCPYWVGDLNWLEGIAGQSGCINGNGLGNAPSAEWFFIEYTRHVNSGNYYVSQRAVGMTGLSAGQIWIRSQQSGSAGLGWGPWSKIMVGMVIRDSALYPFASCPSGTSFIGAMSASGMAVATAEANYWRWINSVGQVWFCS